VDGFLASIQSTKTRSSYKYDLTGFLEFVGSEPITPAVLDGFRSQLISEGAKPATINRKLSAIRAYLKWLVRTGQAEVGLLTASATVQSVRKETTLTRLLTPTELAELLDLAVEPRGRALVLVFLNSGLRVSEAVNLNAEDIDYESNSVIVRGKGQKDRVVFFNQETLAAFALLPESGPLFVNTKGGRLTARSVQRILAEYGAQIGRPDLHPHLLRHQFATTLLRGCKRVELVQKALGHANINTTLGYAQLVQDDLAEAYKGVFG
jgi:integrase/recombinase XerC